MSQSLCLQEHYAAGSICFGCGPANALGLHIRSFPIADELVAEWHPEAKYQAFAGVLYGGLIGCLLDCHCNWAASWHLMKRLGEERPPCTVTADFSVKFLRPTPIDTAIQLKARVLESTDERATVEGELHAAEKLCAKFKGTFVAVKPGHPAVSPLVVAMTAGHRSC